MENKPYGVIYRITNLINGKIYIGQTKQKLKARFYKHVSYSKIGKNMAIANAINKYDKENFKIEEIDKGYSQEELNLLEGFYISQFNCLCPNGYNIKNIIDGKGKHSESTKEKIRRSHNSEKNLKISSNNGIKTRGKSRSGSKSKYCGVSKYKEYWYAYTPYKHLGIYLLETDAAKAYDIEAIKNYGNDCNLNFPELREDYIANKIIIECKKRETQYKIKPHKKSDSKIVGVTFRTKEKKWRYCRYGIDKSFESKEDAEQFALINNIRNVSV
jgi:group I intron endonuclease